MSVKTACDVYRQLQPLFSFVFCTPATSAPVERVFSQSGLIMRPHRSRMSDVLLETLVFTRTWLRYVRVFAVANPSVVCLSVCLSSVTFVHPTQPVEIFGNVSTPFCSLDLRWPPRKILRRSSQGNPYAGG